MKMYKIPVSGHRAKIEEVEVSKVTAHFVTIPARTDVNGCKYRERREAISSRYERYLPTWEIARDALLLIATKNLTSCRLALQDAQGFHGNVKGMTQPTPTPEG